MESGTFVSSCLIFLFYYFASSQHFAHISFENEAFFVNIEQRLTERRK